MSMPNVDGQQCRCRYLMGELDKVASDCEVHNYEVTEEDKRIAALGQLPPQQEGGPFLAWPGRPVIVPPTAKDVTVYEGGATRGADWDGLRYDLCNPEAHERWAARMKLGADKHGEENWKNGIPVSVCINHIEAHLQQYKRRLAQLKKDFAECDDYIPVHHEVFQKFMAMDDDLAGIMAGVAFIMWYEIHRPDLLRK